VNCAKQQGEHAPGIEPTGQVAGDLDSGRTQERIESPDPGVDETSELALIISNRSVMDCLFKPEARRPYPDGAIGRNQANALDNSVECGELGEERSTP